MMAVVTGAAGLPDAFVVEKLKVRGASASASHGFGISPALPSPGYVLE